MIFRVDLVDGGARHFAETIMKIKQKYDPYRLRPWR
jgi:lipoate synthase